MEGNVFVTAKIEMRKRINQGFHFRDTQSGKFYRLEIIFAQHFESASKIS